MNQIWRIADRMRMPWAADADRTRISAGPHRHNCPPKVRAGRKTFVTLRNKRFSRKIARSLRLLSISRKNLVLAKNKRCNAGHRPGKAWSCLPRKEQKAFFGQRNKKRTSHRQVEEAFPLPPPQRAALTKTNEVQQQRVRQCGAVVCKV